MNKKNYSAIDQDFTTFQEEKHVPSMERYEPIGQQIMQVDSAARRIFVHHHTTIIRWIERCGRHSERLHERLV